jgi:hypothetical protein
VAGPFLVGRNRVVINAPAQQVFDYLSDLSRHWEWIGERDFKVTVLPDGPAGPGSQFRREKTGEMQGPLILRGGMGESRVTLIKATVIKVHEPSSVLVLETRNVYNGLLHSIEKFSFYLEPEADGTAVDMISEVEPMVPGMFIGPVYAIRAVRGLFDRLFGKRLSGLFPQMPIGPHLAKIKEQTEAA